MTWSSRLLLAVLLMASASCTQSTPLRASAEEPRTITLCELSRDPLAHNGELVRITSFVTYGFEDFHLADPSCSSVKYDFSVWVTYGGNAESGTVYCCPGEGGTDTRPKALTINGVEVPLQRDSNFLKFNQLLQEEADSTVHATLVGRFFAGEKQSNGERTFWSGFGHLGCCSLFAIQRVESFEPHPRKDMDYTAEAGWYEAGCKYQTMRYRRHVSINYELDAAQEAIREQRLADTGERGWALNDPERVAFDALKVLYGGASPVLRQGKKSPARIVYRWKNGKRETTVVVTRPYWLSFYSKTGQVPWVATTINEAECR